MDRHRDRRAARAAQLGDGGRGGVPRRLPRGTGGMTSRTLLGVWAHPDDEAYLTAGLMAEHRRRGDRVVVVTATLGERGTSDPAAGPPERLARLRRAELRDALAAVGVDEVRVLGLPDGGCDEHDAT